MPASHCSAGPPARSCARTPCAVRRARPRDPGASGRSGTRGPAAGVRSGAADRRPRCRARRLDRRDHRPLPGAQLRRRSGARAPRPEDPSARLRDRTTSLAFVRPPLRSHRLRLLDRGTERLVAWLPSRHRLARRDSVDVTELLDGPIAVRRTADQVPRSVRPAAPKARPVEVADADEELQAVAAGRTITSTAAVAATPLPARGPHLRAPDGAAVPAASPWPGTPTRPIPPATLSSPPPVTSSPGAG
ncbi:LysR substrate-binding domain-containing protein [Amycolatopsis sp. NPDC023774]|uniref:LysR substrate-binding domain-containing protein n=1 Tax=Amycolatopsis sp. NPDC023774 TaxID=3155015 RepID=UPI0033C4FDAD